MQLAPQDALGFPDYFEIPGYSRYAINPEGLVINKQTGIHLEGSTNPDGYHNFRLTGDNGYTLTWGRHRLLGYVFKHPGCNIEDLVINHINGIKGDDRLDNLEWLTEQKNLEHAGQLGLTEKCLPISVRDVDTGEVLSYPSIIEYARCSGLSKDAVAYRIKSQRTRVFPERKQYRLASEKGPWCVPNNIDMALLVNGTSKCVMVRYVFLDSIKEFPRLTDLAEELNIPLPSLNVWLNAPNQPVLPGFIQIKLSTDPTPWREIGDPYLELEAYTGKRAVIVRNVRLKTRVVYTSAVECAKTHGLKPTTLNERLKSRGTKVYSDECTYAYYADSL